MKLCKYTYMYLDIKPSASASQRGLQPDVAGVEASDLSCDNVANCGFSDVINPVYAARSNQ